MSGATTAIIAAAAVVGAGYSIYSGEQQKGAAKDAAAQAKQNADKQAAVAEQEINRRNAKQPNVAALMFGNSQGAQAGASGTSLTGPSGIDPSSLSLGRNTLLGM